MSATYPATGLRPAERYGFVADHPQLAPFLVAVAIFIVSVLVALGFTGLPA
ncbi:MAG TPA: hypothetical protein VFL55_23455 [Acetobacteraceae bacterium]|nr:hypothetical protein [Acetobacteraceae bacterium]